MTDTNKLLKILDRLEKRQELTTQTVTRLEDWQKGQEENVAFVTSSAALTAEESKEIETSLGFLFGKSFRLIEKIDKNLIAGIKIKVGNLVIDSSLRLQLEEMVQSLKERIEE